MRAIVVLFVLMTYFICIKYIFLICHWSYIISTSHSSFMFFWGFFYVLRGKLVTQLHLHTSTLLHSARAFPEWPQLSKHILWIDTAERGLSVLCVLVQLNKQLPSLLSALSQQTAFSWFCNVEKYGWHFETASVQTVECDRKNVNKTNEFKAGCSMK